MKRIISGIITIGLVFSCLAMQVGANETSVKPVFQKVKVERNKEEKRKMTQFIEQYRFFSFNDFDSFDRNNPNQQVMAEFMSNMLSQGEGGLTPYSSKEVDYDDTSDYESRYTETAINKKAMELFGAKLDFSKKALWNYNAGKTKGYLTTWMAQDGNPARTINIKNIYSLGNDLIYIEFDRLGIAQRVESDATPSYLFDDLPSEEKAYLNQGSPGHVILMETMKNGKKSYELYKYSTKVGQLSDEKLLAHSRKKGIDERLEKKAKKIWLMP